MNKNKIKFLETIGNQIDKEINLDKLNPKRWIPKIQDKMIKLSKNNANLYRLNPSIWMQKIQDKVEKLGKNNANQVLLRQSTFWARSITWVLMGGTAFSLGWICLAKTDEVVIAIGQLSPQGGVIDVQMPVEGVADKILIKEGEEVKKGQVLIILDTEITEAKNKALIKTLNLNKTILKKLESLVSVGGVSELQYIQQQAKIEDIKSQVKANLVKLKYQEIISPVDGKIFELQPKSPGYVARTSEPVLKIVPFGNLLAKVEIDSRSIGFVGIGKKAEISIDSFPSTDFGVIEGTITSIGSDALPPIPSLGKGYRFPADITLNNQYLELKSGKKLALQSGMSLNANIKLRKVSYLQLLLSKFVNKANSLKSI